MERGLVASLARPGGNVTGLTNSAGPEIAGKHLQLLKEAVPKISHVAVLTYRANPMEPPYSAMGEMQAAAQALGVTLHAIEVEGPDGFDRAFAMVAKTRAEALLVRQHPFFLNASRIVDFAATYRLPAMYPFKEVVEAGGLMAYETTNPHLPAPRCVRGQDLQGCQAWRPAGGAADQVRPGHQPEDGEGARNHDPEVMFCCAPTR